MTIQLYNTATRSKQELTPIEPGCVSMYVCGPTVYDRAHLGNARAVVVFDMLYRLLRHEYGSDAVTYVRNFTDVDDKINARAAETGRDISDITAETTQWFLDDMAAIGALEPNEMPRATAYVPHMVKMIEGLIEKGHAYAAEGHVLFKVRSYDDYGKLSGRSVDDMLAGARVEVAPYKEDPMDFVLWKPSSDDIPGWDSPWGRGRPGWHIECSAMAYELLGDRFDIHGGGNDLTFPHHENEIAQSKCAGHGFANIWMHNEMLQVEGKKMSKSLGNFFTVRQVLDGTAPLLQRKMSGNAVRISFLLSHYRQVMDFGVERRHEAEAIISSFAKALGRAGEEIRNSLVASEELVDQQVVEFLADDLDVPKAIKHLQTTVKSLPTELDLRVSEIERLYSTLTLLLGVDLKESPIAIDSARNTDELRGVIFRAIGQVDVIATIAQRIDQARASKNFNLADRLKAELQEAGIEVRVTPEGTKTVRTENFDPSKLEDFK